MSIGKRPLLLHKATVICGLMLAGGSPAQTFKTLHHFDTVGGPTSTPFVSYNILYGTTSGGGIWSQGSVFALKVDGTGFTDLHSFIGSDGAGPAGLVLADTILYGTTAAGGFGNGTVFKLTTDGTVFTNLYFFSAFSGHPTNSDGATPSGGLVFSGNTLYGTTSSGGSSGNGTVFALKMDGTGFTNLHSFDGVDGSGPNGLIVSADTLYASTIVGGLNGHGAVFSIRTDGTAFTNLHSFSLLDGAGPKGTLLLSGRTLYGTTATGGGSSNGTVFAVETDGTDFRVLHNFTTPKPLGIDPNGSLVLRNNTLYGMTQGGGTGGGTIFAVNSDGTGFETLHMFTGNEGVYPFEGPTLSGNVLFGTTAWGGIGSRGTVFSFTFSPQLTIISTTSNVILTWPTNYAGFDYSRYTLQTTTELGVSAVWSTNLPPPFVVNGQFTVTNPISGTQQFFRLSQ